MKTYNGNSKQHLSELKNVKYCDRKKNEREVYLESGLLLVLNAGNSFLSPLEFKSFLWGEGGVPSSAFRPSSLTMFIKDPVTNNPAYAPACRAITIVMMVRVFISHIFI